MRMTDLSLSYWYILSPYFLSHTNYRYFLSYQLTLHRYVDIHVQGWHYQEGRTEETFGHSIQYVRLGRMRISYGPLYVTYANYNVGDKIFIRPQIRLRYNAIPFQIVRESADTIVSITERIQSPIILYFIWTDGTILLVVLIRFLYYWDLRQN